MEVEFTDFDIEAVNNYIKDNNYQSFFSLMEEKKEMLKDVVCNMVYSNVESLSQYITDSVYDNWDNSVISREDFIKQLSNYEKIAVMFSNFNYQFEDGGLYQWYDNGYYNDLVFLISFLEKSNYSRKNEFSEILEYIDHIHDSIENLDSYDDWYEEDVQTRLDSFKYLDNDYDRLRESWSDYLEGYLYDNLPKEYLDKIMKLEIKENNISIQDKEGFYK